MACVHLQELFQLCEKHDMRVSSSDLVRIVCHECNSEEVCPSAITSYDDQATEAVEAETQS